MFWRVQFKFFSMRKSPIYYHDSCSSNSQFNVSFVTRLYVKKLNFFKDFSFFLQDHHSFVLK